MNIVTRLMQSSEERRTQRVHRCPCWTLQEFADSVGAKRQALTGLTTSGTCPLPPRPRPVLSGCHARMRCRTPPARAQVRPRATTS